MCCQAALIRDSFVCIQGRRLSLVGQPAATWPSGNSRLEILPGPIRRFRIRSGELGQEPPHQSWPATQMGGGAEQPFARRPGTMGEPASDVIAGAGGPDCLHHCLLRANHLDNGMSAKPIGEPSPRHRPRRPLGDVVRSGALGREHLTGLMALIHSVAEGRAARRMHALTIHPVAGWVRTEGRGASRRRVATCRA
jgi:hypothetical protein